MADSETSHVDIHEKLNALKMHAVEESDQSNTVFMKKLQELDPSIQNLADHIQQRWTHPQKFRDIAVDLTNILRKMMRGAKVSNAIEELEPFRNNINRIHDLIWEKFPNEDGPKFYEIWAWIRNTLFAKLKLSLT
jgi:hypothetical protein